jgi:hypothetical protein
MWLNKINMKTNFSKILWLVVLLITISFCACTESSSADKSTSTGISSFWITHVRLDIDSSTVFTIDETNALIYNYDSLPYQSPKDSFIPTIMGYLLSAVYINDSIEYSGSDTIDFSNLVKLTSYAENGENNQTYRVEVRVHSVDPDLYIWQKAGGNIYTETPLEEKAYFFKGQIYLFVRTATDAYLYRSTDAKTWQKETITLPLTATFQKIIKTATGFLVVDNNNLYETTDGIRWTNSTLTTSLSYLLFELNKKIYALGNDNSIYETSDKIQWNSVASAPSNFPIKGAAINVSYTPNGQAHAYVAGGETANGDFLSTVWSTDNGSYWTELTEGINYFTPRSGASIIQYDGMLMLFGGKDKNGVVSDPHWISSNYGLVWKRPSAKIILSSDFQSRFDQSVIIDDNLGIYIVGGRNFGYFMNNVWTGKKIEFTF